MNPSSKATRLRLVVLISGGGTTLANLLEKMAAGQLDAEIPLVISSNAKARGLEIAQSAGIATSVITPQSRGTPEDYSEALFAALTATARIGIGIADIAEIGRLNILGATIVAMRRAVEALPVIPDLALIDGNRTPDLACPARAIVRGDGRSFSIAAASIVAKVTRDRIMADLARQFPGYGWERNAGYGTAEHRAALARLGPTVHHRPSFAPVRAVLNAQSPA